MRSISVHECGGEQLCHGHITELEDLGHITELEDLEHITELEDL
jgi:hypothetical protein